MKRKSSWAFVFCALAAMAMAQTTPDAQNGASSSSGSMPAGSAKPQADTGSAAQRGSSMAIPATLAKSVDSKKMKAGDEIDVKLSVSLSSASGAQIPAGSKIVGHVTDVKSKGKGDSQSSLTFAFEKIVLKNGQDMPLHAIPQAIGMPRMMADAAIASDTNNRPTPAGSTGGGMRGNANPNSGSGTAATGSSAASSDPMSGGATATGSQASYGPLPQNATGVVGLKGLTLDSQPNGAVVSSDSKSLKLEEGTQLLLRVLSQ